jgi:hypothetical protein
VETGEDRNKLLFTYLFIRYENILVYEEFLNIYDLVDRMKQHISIKKESPITQQDKE